MLRIAVDQVHQQVIIHRVVQKMNNMNSTPKKFIIVAILLNIILILVTTFRFVGNLLTIKFEYDDNINAVNSEKTYQLVVVDFELQVCFFIVNLIVLLLLYSKMRKQCVVFTHTPSLAQAPTHIGSQSPDWRINLSQVFPLLSLKY